MSSPKNTGGNGPFPQMLVSLGKHRVRRIFYLGLASWRDKFENKMTPGQAGTRVIFKIF